MAKIPSVLIVDDDSDTREMYGWCLEGCGFKVALASSSDTALAQVAREIPDAVITDYMLPGGDGFTFADALRGTPATSQVVLILVSGRDFAGEAQARASKLFDRVLLKPVLPDELVRHLMPLLVPHGAEDGAAAGGSN